MTFNALGVAQLALRLCLGAVVGYTALLHSSISTASASEGLIDTVGSSSPTLLLAILAMTAIWIVFGVRTRIVSLLALVCYAAVIRIESLNSFSTVADLLVPFQIVALLALPLILFGGGRFSIYRAGWRNPF